VVCALCAAWGWLQALAEQPSEYDVKAAFLLNFTRFVEWPADAFAAPASPFAICVLGKDPFGRALDDILEGESVNGRKLEARRISEAPAARACQMVFFGTTEKDILRAVRSSGHGVLTVGEGEDFIRAGGAIGFILDNRRVRFDINQAAAEDAGLKLSSKLLNVARSVHKIEMDQQP